MWLHKASHTTPCCRDAAKTGNHRHERDRWMQAKRSTAATAGSKIKNKIKIKIKTASRPHPRRHQHHNRSRKAKRLPAGLAVIGQSDTSQTAQRPGARAGYFEKTERIKKTAIEKSGCPNAPPVGPRLPRRPGMARSTGRTARVTAAPAEQPGRRAEAKDTTTCEPAPEEISGAIRSRNSSPGCQPRSAWRSSQPGYRRQSPGPKAPERGPTMPGERPTIPLTSNSSTLPWPAVPPRVSFAP